MECKFKLGEEVTIIGNSNCHCFNIGEAVLLTHYYDGPTSYPGQIFRAKRIDPDYKGPFIASNVRDYDIVPLSNDTIGPEE
jgi:hypothetical protein